MSRAQDWAAKVRSERPKLHFPVRTELLLVGLNDWALDVTVQDDGNCEIRTAGRSVIIPHDYAEAVGKFLCENFAR